MGEPIRGNLFNCKRITTQNTTLVIVRMDLLEFVKPFMVILTKRFKTELKISNVNMTTGSLNIKKSPVRVCIN